MPAKFAQLVIGPPGSGKSTYCYGMHQFLNAVGRPSSVVNLDPANDNTAYTPTLDVRDLVSLEEIMREENLGPNGGVLHALETLEREWDWLADGLEEKVGQDYVIFDCPGQIELFTHHNSLRNIIFALEKKLGYRLVVLHLVDSYLLTRPSLYISALLLSLRSMLQLDLPTLNVLSKIDNLHNYPELPFDLDFYTEVHDLTHLLSFLAAEQAGKVIKPYRDGDPDPDPNSDTDTDSENDSPLSQKFHALNEAIISLVDDFALVSFEPLVVEDKASMASLLHACDKSNGYAFGAEGGANDTVWQVAVRSGATSMDIRDVQERWIDNRRERDVIERREWEEEARRVEESGRAGQETEDGQQVERDAMDMDMDLDAEMEKLKMGMAGFDSGVTIKRKKPNGDMANG